MRDLFEPFLSYFEIKIADTAELLEQVYRLRYEVFCKEFHYEQEENCPGQLEKDDYDGQSTHCLIIHRGSLTPAGCVRLVNTRQDDPWQPLPIEKYCGASLSQGSLHPSRLPRENLCEISRLAVNGTFRRRPGESDSPFGNIIEGLKFDAIEHRLFPLISFGLFIAVILLSVHTKRKDMFAMMEPWLGKHLQKTGFSFEQVGEPTEYHGTRVAFHITSEQLVEDKERKSTLKGIFDLISPVMEAEAARVKLNWG